MGGLTSPKGGKTVETTQSTQVPQYASAAQQNTLALGTNALAPNIYTPQFTTAPVNSDQSGAYDLARQLAGSAFSSQGGAILPGVGFDEKRYLAANPDVAADPYFSQHASEHFQQYGLKEGRDAQTAYGAFDKQAYLAANPDVAASGMDPYEHYMRFGASEGRGATTAGGTYGGKSVATNPVPTVSMQSLAGISGPNFADPRNDPNTKAGATASGYNAATYDPATYGASQVGGEQIQAQMNPYISNVVDTSNAMARRTMDETLANNRAQQAAAGAFGGSRGAVSDAILQRGFQDSTSANTAQLMSQGWDKATATALANAQMQQSADAANAGAKNTAGQFNAGAQNTAGQFNSGAQNTRDQFNATQGSSLIDQWNKLQQQTYTNQIGARQQDNTNAMTTAQGNEAMRTADFQRQMQGLNALLGVGNAQRDIYQQSLDSPLKMLSMLQGITPQQYSTLQTGSQPNTAASPLQNLLGVGMTFAGKLL